MIVGATYTPPYNPTATQIIPAACGHTHIVCYGHKHVVVENKTPAVGVGSIVGHAVAYICSNGFKHGQVKSIGGRVVTHCIGKTCALHLGGIGGTCCCRVSGGGVAGVGKGCRGTSWGTLAVLNGLDDCCGEQGARIAHKPSGHIGDASGLGLRVHHQKWS